MLQFTIKEEDKAIFARERYEHIHPRVCQRMDALWKWVKKDCLNCKYYSKFCEFKTAIDNSLSKIITGQAQSELESLLTLKFQLFK